MKVLADENIPWPLIKLLRNMGLDVAWIPETSYRGINDTEVVSLANRDERAVLTRDSDFLKLYLREKSKYGIIYVDEPIRRDNVEKLARNIVKGSRDNKEKATFNNSYIQYHRVIPTYTIRYPPNRP